MRPAQGGAAAKHQTEWRDAGSAYRRQRLDDVPVLFDKGGARQAKMTLDFEQVLQGWIIAQGQVPDCHH